MKVDQAYKKIIDIIDQFIELSAYYNYPIKMHTVIEDVKFKDVISLYYKLLTPNKRLLLPEEYDGEALTLIYTPVPGCVIGIESDRCWKVMPNINNVKGDPYIDLKISKKEYFCMN